MGARTFGDELQFLCEHTSTVVLDAATPSMVAVAPAWGGRVMTSTLGGADGESLGWINRAFIASGQSGTAFDNFGGEERFWLGPEGGQFALWFAEGQPFDLDHWKTPEGFNPGVFEVTSQGGGSVAMAAGFEVTNYSGTRFTVAVKRIIDVFDRGAIAAQLGAEVPQEVECVGFGSTNTLANVGAGPWTPAGGLLSIWTLGQFVPSERGLVIAPFIGGDDPQLGPMPNGEYFGPVPPERFRLADGHALFRCDGKFRSKLGVGPGRARDVLGSFDPDAGLLTIVKFSLPADAAALPYVNSLWEIQDAPCAGDVVNSYNDGGTASPAEQSGAFYELETSSPAAELAPDEAITHVNRTYHFAGKFEPLNALSQAVLGVDLGGIDF